MPAGCGTVNRDVGAGGTVRTCTSGSQDDVPWAGSRLAVDVEAADLASSLAAAEAMFDIAEMVASAASAPACRSSTMMYLTSNTRASTRSSEGGWYERALSVSVDVDGWDPVGIRFWIMNPHHMSSLPPPLPPSYELPSPSLWTTVAMITRTQSEETSELKRTSNTHTCLLFFKCGIYPNSWVRPAAYM